MHDAPPALPPHRQTAQTIRALIRLATGPHTPEGAETLVRSVQSDHRRVALTAAVLVLDLADGTKIDPGQFDLLLEV